MINYSTLWTGYEDETNARARGMPATQVIDALLSAQTTLFIFVMMFVKSVDFLSIVTITLSILHNDCKNRSWIQREVHSRSIFQIFYFFPVL